MLKTCLLFVGLLTGVAFSETLDNEFLKIEFADSSNGFGIESVVNKEAGDVRFVNPDGVPTDRWRVEEYRHCPNFCWPCPEAGKSLADFWEIELRDARALGDRTKAVFLDNRSPSRGRSVRREADGATFVWTGVKLPEGEVDVRAHVGFAADGTSRWTIDADVRSSRFVLHNTRYPILRHVVKPGEADYLEPRADFGAKLRRKAGYDKEPKACGVLAYVPMMTAFMIGDAGLYIAAHDERVNTKTLVITGDRDVTFSSPEPRGGFEVTVAAFKGDWWQAARIYRKWAMTAPWCRKGRILDRDDYPRRLCEIPLWFNFHGKAAAASNALTRAKELFPDVTTGLHWHRWQAVPWEIGHYPEYFPEDEGVRDCLKYCRSIGQEPLLYALPRLYSKSLLSFHFAEPYAVMDESGKYCVEQYGRLEDHPPELVQMCPGVGKWQDCVVDYTTRMFDLGARSVFQDQVSSCPAKSCYGAGHDHRPGGGTWFYESVRAICARTHEVARVRGGFTADEGSVDAFNDVVDGHLTVTQRTPEDVPFWHAVYNGYTTYFGSPENHDDDDDTFWAMQTRDVLWGQSLGWYHPLLMDRPEKVALVRNLVDFRQANLDCLAYGELLGEVAFSGEVPTRALTMLGRKSFPDWANPNAKLSPTITGTMAGVLGYLYRSGVTGRTCALVANLMPDEVTVSCSLKAPNDRLVLAPREIRRIEIQERQETVPFVRAVGVWPAGEREAVNAFFGFRGDFDAKAGGKNVLRIAASGAFRLFVNGTFVGYGPARGPVGHFRVDEWDLSPYVKDGPNALAIEAVNYGVQNYYLPYAPGFVQAEVLVDGRVALATAKDGGFGAVRLPKVRNTTRYTFQRGFAEYYKVGVKAWNWRIEGRGKSEEGRGESEEGGLALAETPAVPLLPRRAPLPLFELKRPKIVGVTEAVFEPGAKLAVETAWFLKGVDDGIRKGYYRGSPSSKAELNMFETVQRVQIGATKSVTSERSAIGAGKGALVDVGVNDTGFLGCVVDCRKPGRLIVTFDEILTDGKVDPVRLSAGNGFVYDLLEPGRYRLETFEPYTMRYAHFCFADGEGDVSDVTFRTYKNAEAYAATFDSSDPALNRIFAAARETFAQNAVDVFTDCPSRERAGWLCDSFFTARVNRLLTGSVGLETLFLENFAIPAAFDVDAGMLPMCYPSDHTNGNFIPNWAMWAVIEIDEYVRRGGDPELVAKLKPRLEKLVDFLWKFRNADGLLEKMPRWNFIEWSQANKWVQDVNYPSNMTWAEVLDCMNRLYGRADLAAEAKKVRETVRRQSWNGTWFCDHAVRRADGSLEVRKDEITETCQYYAFFFKVATPETHPALWKTLVDEFGPKRYDPNDRKKMLAHPEIWPSNAFIGNYLRLELLSRAGLVRNIVDETRGYFLYMADRTGTLWENDTPARSSCNHGFASHAAVLLVRDVLGVKAIDYARRTVTLRAEDVPLAHCAVTLPTPEGKMTLGWALENGRRVWKNALPPGWSVMPR